MLEKEERETKFQTRIKVAEKLTILQVYTRLEDARFRARASNTVEKFTSLKSTSEFEIEVPAKNSEFTLVLYLVALNISFLYLVALSN